jgi:hypothetical protein
VFFIIAGVGIGGTLIGTLNSIVQDIQSRKRSDEFSDEGYLSKIKNWGDEQIRAFRNSSVAVSLLGEPANEGEEGAGATKERDSTHSQEEEQNRKLDAKERRLSSKYFETNSIQSSDQSSVVGSDGKKRTKSILQQMLAPFKGKQSSSRHRDSGKKLDAIRAAFITSYDEELVELRRSGYINLFVIFMITAVGAACMAAIEGWGGNYYYL